MESRRYRFGPHPHAGWLLGLRGSQVAGTIGAGVFAIALLRVGGTVSLLLVIGELGAAFCVIGLRFAGHTALEWVPVVARFAYARAAGRARWRSQTARMGHVTQLPHGAQLDPREVLPPISLRAELSDLELLEVRLPRFGGVAMGVVHDKRAHSFTATVRCEARAFYLLGDAEREMMLASYGALLTTFASDDSPVRRIAWYERTLPPGSDELVEYLHEHHRPDLADDDRGLHATWQLLSAQGRGSEDHEVLVSLQIDSQRATAARSIFHLGGGTDGALSLLADQVSKLVDELTRIGVQSAQPVGARNPAVPSARGLAAIIRNGVDPFGRHERDRGTNGGIGTDSFGPRARETEWNHIVADGRKERALREGAFVRERSQQSTWRRMTPDGLVRPTERAGHLASTVHAQAAYPFVAQASLGSRGVLVGRNVYGGVFALDPWELYAAGLLQDPNMLVLGLTGYGKSALCKTWVFRQRVFGRRIEIIERKGEYGPVVAAMGGATLRLEPGVRLNPLERVGTRESRESLRRAVTRALLDRELTPAERVGLSAALGAVDARCSDREVVVPDVVTELREPSADLALELNVSQEDARAELRQCMLALRDLSTGPLHGMFDGPTNASAGIWDRPAVAIDISQIARHAHGADENTALAIALVCATAFLDGQRHARDRRSREAGRAPDKTVRVNDEAWRALAVPGAAAYYSSALKLSRDTGVQYVIALHRLSDLSATGQAGSRTQQLAEGLASEAAIRVIYRQAEREAPLTADSLQLSSTERALITQLGQGEALWRVGERGFRVRHLIADAEWELVQTDEGMGARQPRAVGRAA